MLYIAKASNEGVCFCECEDSLMSVPDQLDCPWCGCGWLFCCTNCGKAFTFGKAVEVSFELHDEFILADFDRRGFPEEMLTQEFAASMREMLLELLADVEEGVEYVYFDGILIPTDYDDRIAFGGLHSVHDLSELPHLAVRDDSDALRASLGTPDYWHSTARDWNEAGGDSQED